MQAERDTFKVKGEELEEELEASKGREEATTARLDETSGRLEASHGFSLFLPSLLRSSKKKEKEKKNSAKSGISIPKINK